MKRAARGFWSGAKPPSGVRESLLRGGVRVNWKFKDNFE